MDNRAKFYCWLIGKLERRRMTIQEICDDWAESSSNIDGKELSVRTFHRQGRWLSLFHPPRPLCGFRGLRMAAQLPAHGITRRQAEIPRQGDAGEGAGEHAVSRRHHPGH